MRDEVIFETALRHTDFDDAAAPCGVAMEIVKVADEQGRPIDAAAVRRPARGAARTRDARGAPRLPRRPDDADARCGCRRPFNETGTFRSRSAPRFEDEEDRRLDSVAGGRRQRDARSCVRGPAHQGPLRRQPPAPRLALPLQLPHARARAQIHESRTDEARSRFEVHVLLQSADPAFRQPASLGRDADPALPQPTRASCSPTT